MPVLAHDPVIAWALRLSLACLFAAAAVHKARDPTAFRATVARYRLLPDRLAGAAARAVTGLELAVAALLVARPADPLGPAAALALLALYSAAVGVNLARGRRDIDCGCLGPGRRQALSGWLLARNAVVAAGAAVACAAPGTRALVWLDHVALVGTVGTLALMWAIANRLIATAPRSRLARGIR